MSRKPQQKASTLENIADYSQDNIKLYSAAIVKVNSNGKIDTSGSIASGATFLLNPSSWEETKTANWIKHQIPGQSDPILQWASSGPRVVTFEALVTRETTHFTGTESNSLLSKALNVVGSIASSFAGVNIPPIGDLFGSGDQGAGDDLSIASILDYYRSFMYPTYDNDQVLQSSPNLAVLYVGSSFSNTVIGKDVNLSTDIPVWVVDSVKIVITKQLPNLSPMEAKVQFQLTQYAVAPLSADVFSGLPLTSSPESQIINNPSLEGLGKTLGFA